VIGAVVFDLDGLLLDSEQLWDEVRREVVASHGGGWRDEATGAMQGMSSPEWSRYLHDELGLDLPVDQIVQLVVAGLRERYRRRLPLLPGAMESVRRVAERWPLGLASSSNREIIDEVLADSGLRDCFGVTVSSEEVAHGKPAPDVYLEAARQLGKPPQDCVAVEDAANGVRSALAAGMRVVVVPNRHYPPPAAVVAKAAAVLQTLEQLDVGLLEQLDVERRLDEQELESFPASDPHSDWAGPAR
jgi:HAD superfamily hydrolase (TIGR01509 family)